MSAARTEMDNSISLDTITELDNKIQSLDQDHHDQKTLSLLEAEDDPSVEASGLVDQGQGCPQPRARPHRAGQPGSQPPDQG